MARWAAPLLALTAACAGGPDPVEVAAPAPETFVDVASARYDVVRDELGQPVRCAVALEIADGDDGGRRLVTHAVSLAAGGGPERWLPEGVDAKDRALVRVGVRYGDGPVVESWSAPRAVPLGSIDPRVFARGDALAPAAALQPDDPRPAFVDFCERLLLVRDPMAGDPAPGEIARAWFGGAVAAGHPIVRSLGDVCVALFAEEDEAAARALTDRGWHRPGEGAEWAVARWLVLRDEIGADAFRGVLRALVDEHVGGGPIGLDEVVEAFETEEARAYVRAWFAGPGRPRVQTSWRFDSSRERLLLRVEQIHELEPGTALAYPFTLPLVIVTKDGATLERSVDVGRRRELFEVPCDAEPAVVRIDPEVTLGERVELVEKDED